MQWQCTQQVKGHMLLSDAAGSSCYSDMNKKRHGRGRRACHKCGSYLATVTKSAEPSSSSKTLWILPLPKVRSPIRVARWLSCRAPARISLADALPPLTSTARGAFVIAEPASNTTLYNTAPLQLAALMCIHLWQGSVSYYAGLGKWYSHIGLQYAFHELCEKRKRANSSPANSKPGQAMFGKETNGSKAAASAPATSAIQRPRYQWTQQRGKPMWIWSPVLPAGLMRGLTCLCLPQSEWQPRPAARGGRCPDQHAPDLQGCCAGLE